MKQIKKKISSGLLETKDDDPFELFISSTDIRYCYYNESDKILGSTYGMLVLQDFEALTPNLLARTIETVQGGGMIVLLLKTINSLKQLYTMTMDVHSRYRTEAHCDLVARFNERFLLSLSKCNYAVALDDSLNVLPITALKSEDLQVSKSLESEISQELIEFKKSQKEIPIIGPLISAASTLDQAKVVCSLVTLIKDKSSFTTASLTAARGRGKSAALGLAVASAVSSGYSNIFITSPSPENLKTLFQFMIKGLGCLGYEEHLDYSMVYSTDPDHCKLIVRVNIFKSHRQTIQYIPPNESKFLGQAELVIIDEAAAIPLPLVKALLGPYLVLMASTINGYEGTGRSLSLKLIQQLREQSASFHAAGSSRRLLEVSLDEPIRYSRGDPIESWLNQLLCLDVELSPKASSGCPHPSNCELYYVSRDTLFSFHPASEAFLQRLMALYVASHYKNSPNDLQLLSDAPAHHLFVLLPPVNVQTNVLPEILCVIQVSLEGEISKDSILSSLAKGKRGGGDLIPWTLSQQFQDSDFASLSGARIVRIATHPEYQKMGYGSRALELVEKFYRCELYDADSEPLPSIPTISDIPLDEIPKPRKGLPPLLLNLSEVPPTPLHWIGSSFGLMPSLLKFWKKASYVPVYLRQTQNQLTGEHTVIVLKTMGQESQEITCSNDWLPVYAKDFRKRFISLLSFQFRHFSPIMALSVLESSDPYFSDSQQIQASDLAKVFSSYDLKRLESYSNSLLDYHTILDMLPTIAQQYFSGEMKVSLSPVQSAILLSVGLQRKEIEDIQKDINLPVSQILAMFIKVVRKITAVYRGIEESRFATSLDQQIKPIQLKNPHKDEDWDPTEQSLDAALEEGGEIAISNFREKQRELIQSLDLSQYAIGGDEKEWQNALVASKKIVSIPNKSKASEPVAKKLMKKLEEDKETITKKRKNGGKKNC